MRCVSNGSPIWEPHVSEEEEIKKTAAPGQPRNRTPHAEEEDLFSTKQHPQAKTEEDNERKKKGCQIASTPRSWRAPWAFGLSGYMRRRRRKENV